MFYLGRSARAGIIIQPLVVSQLLQRAHAFSQIVLYTCTPTPQILVYAAF